MIGLNVAFLPLAVVSTAVDTVTGNTQGTKDGLKLTGLLIADITFQVLQRGGLKGIASRMAQDVPPGLRRFAKI